MGHSARKASRRRLLHYYLVPDCCCLKAVRRLYAATPSSMFNVAAPFGATKGIVWQGYVAGAAYNSLPGAYSDAVIYSSSNECSDSDQEYGFFTDTTQSSNGQASGEYWVAYYSTATNTSQQQTSTPPELGCDWEPSLR